MGKSVVNIEVVIVYKMISEKVDLKQGTRNVTI